MAVKAMMTTLATVGMAQKKQMKDISPAKMRLAQGSLFVA
jgi:hypothetical protein